jgi:hypothetical protein
MSDRFNLPAIHGATAIHRSADQVPPIPDANPNPNLSDKFSSFQQLSTISFPEINNELNMKTRISTLEAATVAQNDFNNKSCKTFEELNNEVIYTEDRIMQVIKQVQDNFDSKLVVMKKEYDHRYGGV